MGKEQPLVSVIIACYNGESYIDSCIESLTSQTYPNIEIIVCDDCSTDNSLQKLNEWKKKDSRIVVIHNEKNEFAAASRNKCIDKSHGDFLMIQDVDDYSENNRVEKLLEVLSCENVDFVSSSASVFYKNPQIKHAIMKMKKEYPTKYNFWWGISFIHPATMFRSSCINEVGGYRVSSETRRCQDYDLFMRLYAKGYKGKNVRECLYRYRIDADNYKRRTFKARLGEVKIRKRGYRELKIMFPLGFIFAYKPIASHVVQKFKNLFGIRGF